MEISTFVDDKLILVDTTDMSQIEEDNLIISLIVKGYRREQILTIFTISFFRDRERVLNGDGYIDKRNRYVHFRYAP